MSIASFFADPVAAVCLIGFVVSLYVIVLVSRIDKTVTVRRGEDLIPFIEDDPDLGLSWVRDAYDHRKPSIFDPSLDSIRSHLAVNIDAVATVYREGDEKIDEIEANRLATILVVSQAINILRNTDERTLSSMVTSIIISDPRASRARETLSDLARKEVVQRERTLIRKPLSGVRIWIWFPPVFFAVGLIWSVNG